MWNAERIRPVEALGEVRRQRAICEQCWAKIVCVIGLVYVSRLERLARILDVQIYVTACLILVAVDS